MLRSINWILTDSCNSRCKHCDMWQNTINNSVTLKEVNLVLNNSEVKSGYEHYKKLFDISLGGGEPFLNEHMSSIIDTIENNYPGSLKSISTNGLLKDKILNFLEEKSHLNFKLNISIDGLEDIHDKIRGKGAFRKTVNTIRTIRKKFPKQKVEIKFTLMQDNYKELLKVYRLSEKLGTSFSFKPIENMEYYTNKRSKINTNFSKEELCRIRNDSFKLSDAMYNKGEFRKAKFYQDIPFYLTGNKKPKTCSVINNHVTLMPTGDAHFCIMENKIGDITHIPKIDKISDCSSCMLMCGSFKDYSNNYFAKRTANIESILDCNLNCKICTQKNISANMMDMETFISLIAKNPKITHVSFVGGEPLIDSLLWKRLAYLDTKGITYEITTNGTKFDNIVLSKIIDCIGLRKINFSLDGTKEYHDSLRGKGTYDLCMAAIMKAKNYFHISISSIIKNDNLTEIFDLIKVTQNLGLDHKLIYAMYHTKEQIEATQNRILDILISSQNNPIEQMDTKLIPKIMVELKNTYGSKVSFEPNIMQDKDFSNSLMPKIKCKQLNEYRFNSDGKRIICEFIRNEYGASIAEDIENKLLPICSKCCKLTR